MSIFQAVLSCLLPGFTAGKPTSANNASLRYNTRSTLGRSGSVVSSRLSGSSSVVSQTEIEEDALIYFKRHYGLGLLIAQCIPGFCNPLRLLARTVRFASTPSDNVPSRLSGLRTPSPLSLFGVETPGQFAHPRQYTLGFARATPPKITWLPAPVDAPATPEPAPSEDDEQGTQEYTPKAFVDSAAMYISALHPYYPIPPPRQYKIVIPAYEDVHDSANASRRETQAAWSPTVPTTPAHQLSLRPVPTAPAHPSEAQLCVGQKRRLYDSNLADDGNEYDDGQDDGEDYDSDSYNGYNDDKPCLTPRHPDGTEYHIFGMLGEGSFGRVMLAGTSTGELVALKVMHKPMLYHSPGMRQILYNERDLMSMVVREGAPFLMQLKAAWEEEDNVYLAMDLCAEDLRSRIRRAARSGIPIPPEEMKLLCAEMLFALIDLSLLEIVHGDIKPDNILITKTGRIVLSDLGLSQCALTLDPARDEGRPFCEWSAPETIGTPGYYAPEVLLRYSQAPTSSFTSQADVFSMGLVFLELFCGLELPLWDPVDDPTDIDVDVDTWRNMDLPQRQAARMMVEGIRRVLDENWIADEDARDMVQLMLLADPKERPTPTKLLGHPYLSDVDLQSVFDGTARHAYTPCFFSSLKQHARDLSFPTYARGEGRHLKRGELYMEQDRGPLEGFTYPTMLMARS
ncbi:kinase-like domain-containing protein [Cubamyces lactineus]|nr:kinase-like domain-containing protein [Cubamyces lactineus]